MSRFIGELAFSDPSLVDEVEIGVLGGSLPSAFTGHLVVRWVDNRKRKTVP